MARRLETQNKTKQALQLLGGIVQSLSCGGGGRACGTTGGAYRLAGGRGGLRFIALLLQCCTACYPCSLLSE